MPSNDIKGKLFLQPASTALTPGLSLPAVEAMNVLGTSWSIDIKG